MPNQLISQTSPYLLQHAHNPVDWYPWCDEALQAARQHNKPILVSIGYSACHWCHVMERESFEDGSVAAFMNAHFINIKIDREERPDLDHIYMDAVQAISGSGGWPLNVFLTPEALPFYGGTYYPPVPAYNRSSWMEVLQAIHQAWSDKPEEILAQADNLTGHIKTTSFLSPVTSPGTSPDLDAIAESIMKQADKQEGGFGAAPKFPQTGAILFLLRQAWHALQSGDEGRRSAGAIWQEHALLSLRKMAAGGINDQLAGGFARYSTDPGWLVPHFEKMLYDNALLLRCYTEGWQAAADKQASDTVYQLVRFMLRSFKMPNGLYAAAFDADSEGEEGAYYTWTHAEIKDVLGDNPFTQLFCDYYGVTAEGNWEGTNILHTPESLPAFCKARHLDSVKFEQELLKADSILLQHRDEREAPLRDDKAILCWNALWLHALSYAAGVFGEKTWMEEARSLAGNIEKQLRNHDGTYLHHIKDDQPGVPAFLDDLAGLALAYAELASVSGSQVWLKKAIAIAEDVEHRFGSSENDGPGFYYTPREQADIVVRKKDMYDGATPSGNALMAMAFQKLALLETKPGWDTKASEMLNAIQPVLVRYPLSFAYWALALQWKTLYRGEWIVAGSEAADWGDLVFRVFSPFHLKLCLPEPRTFPGMGISLPTGISTAFFRCQQFACQRPVTSLDELKKCLSTLDLDDINGGT